MTPINTETPETPKTAETTETPKTTETTETTETPETLESEILASDTPGSPTQDGFNFDLASLARQSVFRDSDVWLKCKMIKLYKDKQLHYTHRLFLFLLHILHAIYSSICSLHSLPRTLSVENEDNPYDYRKLLRKTSMRGRLIEQS
ncbi:myosin-IIIa [Tachysurus ichikawai]